MEHHFMLNGVGHTATIEDMDAMITELHREKDIAERNELAARDAKRHQALNTLRCAIIDAQSGNYTAISAKIRAIKALREIGRAEAQTDCRSLGLRDAKDVIELLFELMNIK